MSKKSRSMLEIYGCYLCNEKHTNNQQLFSVEFDAPVHLYCLLKEWHREDRMARLITKEFGGIDNILDELKEAR